MKKNLETEMAALFAAKTPFLVVDTETTGFLNDQNSQIIELVTITGDGACAFSGLFRPDAPIPAKASQVHGLYERDLATMPPFAARWAELLGVLHQYPAVYAYNAAFDRGMLLKTARRFSCEIPAWLLAQPWHCIMEAYAEYYGDWSDYHGSYTFKRLADACQYLRVPMSESHRATGDALNTLALMRALAARGTVAEQR